MQDLALEVAHVHEVGIDEADGADAGRGEIERRRRTEPPCPDHQDARLLQPALAGLTDVGQE